MKLIRNQWWTAKSFKVNVEVKEFSGCCVMVTLAWEVLYASSVVYLSDKMKFPKIWSWLENIYWIFVLAIAIGASKKSLTGNIWSLIIVRTLPPPFPFAKGGDWLLEIWQYGWRWNMFFRKEGVWLKGGMA